jgi:hypothetical protein
LDAIVGFGGAGDHRTLELRVERHQRRSLVWAPDGRRFAVVLEKARIVTMAIDGSDRTHASCKSICFVVCLVAEMNAGLR